MLVSGYLSLDPWDQLVRNCRIKAHSVERVLAVDVLRTIFDFLDRGRHSDVGAQSGGAPHRARADIGSLHARLQSPFVAEMSEMAARGVHRSSWVMPHTDAWLVAGRACRR